MIKQNRKSIWLKRKGLLIWTAYATPQPHGPSVCFLLDVTLTHWATSGEASFCPAAPITWEGGLELSEVNLSCRGPHYIHSLLANLNTLLVNAPEEREARIVSAPFSWSPSSGIPSTPIPRCKVMKGMKSCETKARQCNGSPMRWGVSSDMGALGKALEGCEQSRAGGTGRHGLPAHYEPGSVLASLWRFSHNKGCWHEKLIKFYFILTTTQWSRY